MKRLSPIYLTSYLQLHNNPIYQIKSTAKNIVKQTASRTVKFNNAFFPGCSQECNNLSDDIKSLPLSISFKKTLLSFVKTSENSVFAIHDNSVIKLLTRIRLKISHLNEHKFRHNCLSTINPVCSCGSEPETTAHFLLRCLENFNFNLSKEIIKLTICYLKDTERFHESLMWNICCCFFSFYLLLLSLFYCIVTLIFDIYFYSNLKAHSLD